VLALGTVAITAGVIAVKDLIAGRAGIDMPAQRLGPTRFNICHRLQMTGRHPVTELFPVGRAMLTEDFG